MHRNLLVASLLVAGLIATSCGGSSTAAELESNSPTSASEDTTNSTQSAADKRSDDVIPDEATDAQAEAEQTSEGDGDSNPFSDAYFTAVETEPVARWCELRDIERVAYAIQTDGTPEQFIKKYTETFALRVEVWPAELSEYLEPIAAYEKAFAATFLDHADDDFWDAAEGDWEGVTDKQDLEWPVDARQAEAIYYEAHCVTQEQKDAQAEKEQQRQDESDEFAAEEAAERAEIASTLDSDAVFTYTGALIGLSPEETECVFSGLSANELFGLDPSDYRSLLSACEVDLQLIVQRSDDIATDTFHDGLMDQDIVFNFWVTMMGISPELMTCLIEQLGPEALNIPAKQGFISKYRSRMDFEVGVATCDMSFNPGIAKHRLDRLGVPHLLFTNINL